VFSPVNVIIHFWSRFCSPVGSCKCHSVEAT